LAAIKPRLAALRRMSAGSPSVTLLELRDRRVNNQRAVGTLAQPNPSVRWRARLPPPRHRPRARSQGASTPRAVKIWTLVERPSFQTGKTPSLVTAKLL